MWPLVPLARACFIGIMSLELWNFHVQDSYNEVGFVLGDKSLLIAFYVLRVVLFISEYAETASREFTWNILVLKR